MIRDPRVKIFRRKEGGLIVSLPFHRRCFCSPPRGGRQEIGYKEGRGNKFLLTPPHGGRLKISEDAITEHQFLLTPPHGGRLRPCGGHIHREPISTHAPAWGATHVRFRRWRDPPISTHAPAWGRPGGGNTVEGVRKHFYSRPRMGAIHRLPPG